MTARPILTGLESQAQGAREVLAAYAANAYPKLVEALQAFAKSGAKETNMHRGAAFALLRELGEPV